MSNLNQIFKEQTEQYHQVVKLVLIEGLAKNDQDQLIDLVRQTEHLHSNVIIGLATGVMASKDKQKAGKFIEKAIDMLALTINEKLIKLKEALPKEFAYAIPVSSKTNEEIRNQILKDIKNV